MELKLGLWITVVTVDLGLGFASDLDDGCKVGS